MSMKSLFETYKNYFPIGAAVSQQTINSHKELLVKHFNSITAENDMKFSETHPQDGVYTFEKADNLAEFAKENNMLMRGHTLVWHAQTPDWVFAEGSKPVSKEVLLNRMYEHIQKVAGRYREKVYCWDVVNEAVEDASGGYLRKSIWKETIGDEYLAKAFEYAHEADPSAKLFYNDYNECDEEKSEKIVKLVKSLKDSAPIHGLGLQGHWNIKTPSMDTIKRTLDKYAKLGLELQITEMDISLYEHEDKSVHNDNELKAALEKQSEVYGSVFEIFRQYKDVITE